MKKEIYGWYYGYLIGFLVLTSACTKDRTPVNQSTSNDLISFVFKKEKNPDLWNNIETEINGDTIYAHTLVGTDLTALIPEFEHNGVAVVVDDIKQESGKSAQDFSQLIDYTVAAADGSTRRYIVKFADTGLPAIYLFTDGQPIESKEIYVDGAIKITKGLEGKVLFEGITEIRGRGNSTWGMPKKPYRIKLADKAPLLGMPADKNWALLANYGDQSLLRNEVAFEVSRRLALEYTPRQQFVELFLNGEYMGNYTLTEHIKEGEDRVVIDEDNGGLVVEVDGYAAQEPSHFYTPRGVPVTIKFPDEDDITPDEFQYISDYVTSFEQALFSPGDGADADYQQYFDLASFVNYYLVNEICGNPDMLWSMRMYKKSTQDPKLYVGPVWDFDLGFNNDKRLGNSETKLMLTDAHEPRAWMNKLLDDPEFKQLARNRWNEVKEEIQSIPAYVDEKAEQIKYSQLPNFQRWDVLGVNVNQSWFTGGTHQDYVNFIRNYLTVRIAWLDGVINGGQFD